MNAQETIITQTEEMNSTETQAQPTTPAVNVELNKLAAGALTKTVDTAVAVSQFAVGTTIGVGQITLDSMGKLFMSSTETINTQFGGLVNRIFGVRS